MSENSLPFNQTSIITDVICTNIKSDQDISYLGNEQINRYGIYAKKWAIEIDNGCVKFLKAGSGEYAAFNLMAKLSIFMDRYWSSYKSESPWTCVKEIHFDICDPKFNPEDLIKELMDLIKEHSKGSLFHRFLNLFKNNSRDKNKHD